jgi:mannosyltransferase
MDARTGGDARSRDARNRAAWAVGVLILVSLAIRVPRIGAANLWLDEANSWLLAKYSLPALLANIRASPGSPLYFVLLKLWVVLFGESESALRSLSLVVSLALIPVTYALGARTVSRRAGFLAALLLACAPMQIYYAQEARVYMLVTLLTTCSVLAYVAWRQAVCEPENPAGDNPDTSPARSALLRSGGAALAAYVVSAILAIYTLDLAALALVALNVDALLTGARMLRAHRRVWPLARNWCLAQIAVGIACLPLALAIDFRTAAHSQDWRRALGIPDAIRGLLDFFASTIHGGYLYPWDLYHAFADGWGAGAMLERSLAYPLTILAVLAALSYPPRHARTGPIRAVYLVLAIPLLAGVAVSVKHELTLPRYFLFTTPCLYVLIGAGLARMTRWLRATFLVVLLATMGIGVATYQRVGSRDSDYRPVARRLAPQLRPGDAILIQPPEMGVPLSYYLRAHPVAITGLTAGAPVRGALTPAPGRTWLLLDYRSGTFGGDADSLAKLLPGHVLTDIVENPGGSGVRVIEVDSAAPAHIR